MGSDSSERGGNRSLLLARGTLWGAAAGAAALLGALAFNLATGGHTWSTSMTLMFALPAVLVGAVCGLLVAAVGWGFVRRRTQTASRRSLLVFVVALAAILSVGVIALGMAWFANVQGAGFLPGFGVWMLVLAPALPVCIAAVWHTRRTLIRREAAVTQCLPAVSAH